MYSDVVEKPKEHHYIVGGIENSVSKTRVKNNGLASHYYYDSFSLANKDMKALLTEECSRNWIKNIAIVKVPYNMPLLERSVEFYHDNQTR